MGSVPESLANTKPPIEAPLHHNDDASKKHKTYADVFQGVRQDSGDPKTFVKLVREFYDKQGIKDKKTIVFSDSLKVDKCLEYKAICEEAGFQPSFGVGTFFTSMCPLLLFFKCLAILFTDGDAVKPKDDFIKKSTNTKSIPLNIVIKISSAAGRPAVKLSDNLGKNTGDKAIVQEVKQRLGYVEKVWEEGNEATRWGKKGE